jgi:hypothetical protein
MVVLSELLCDRIAKIAGKSAEDEGRAMAKIKKKKSSDYHMKYGRM